MRYAWVCLWFFPSLALAWGPQPLVAPLPCRESLPAVEFQPTEEYSTSNAFMMQMAGFLAEVQDAPLIQAQLEAWGFKDIVLYGKPRRGAYAYLADMDDFRLLAFRGTNSIEEAVQDAIFFMSSNQDLGLEGYSHHGMKAQYKKVSALLQKDLASRIANDPKPLFIAGHSLGGAMALLQAMQLKKQGLEVHGVYTSGQPRVGNRAFYEQAEALLSTHYHRIEQPGDLTPKSPPSAAASAAFAALLPAREHRLRNLLSKAVGGLDYAAPKTWKLVLHQEGLRFVYESDEGDEANFWQQLSGSLEGVKSLPDFIGRLQERMSQHPTPEYLCRFAKLFEYERPRF